MSQKTYMPDTSIGRKKWVLFDARGKSLGRLASRVARVLRGKHKPEFTPHLDCGDGAIVINAEKVQLTGAKEEYEYRRSHSGYIGGLKEITVGEMLEKNPARLIELAVKGMLPKTRLRDPMMKHLRIYQGDTHPHEAQEPVSYDWENETIN